eukprot:TRINITY_DN16578_c0_g1_i1.p1 TRINITY_DN16578_c0_g1~~TRINITY_DN16578_c0_g1_i1.p1  ORF type:complete len:1345 (-),score=252.95 TRINITY_DN16578_c0_g1_i1:21-4055(-)
MEGAQVYIQDASTAWRRATVTAALGSGRYTVLPEVWEEDGQAEQEAPLEVDASKLDGGMLPFQNANMPEKGFPDMTTLDHLHEPALLHNLRRRFFAQACSYTYTADIVIAMNPYRWFPQLYTEEKRKEYLVFDRSKLEPHVYATSSAAYAGLQESKLNQTILVSGESGAGKTETVKILMAHLAFVASSDDSSHIRRIVESNPLLESFGNAQTVRNDNSSRFGKFIELQLNGDCRLEGSKCRTYLLEKSRVVGQDSGERNFHIFYQMLAADAETRSAIGLGDTSLTRDSLRYTSMGSSKTDTIEGKTDAERFNGTVSALALVGVENAKLTGLLRALSSVLLLGQLEFTGSDESSSFSSSASNAASEVAALLGLGASDIEQALTNVTLRVRNEAMVKPLPASTAAMTRDALAKEIYARVFDWLVEQICAATAATGEKAQSFVGLLDIFGFESFAINRFEQLCINYANEKLQQKFTHDVFKAVQQEYAAEGIPWDKIEFKDNAPILALIESKLGIVAMLNEECVRPKGSDQNFVSKLVSVHKEDAAFSAPKLGKMRELQFCIRHYAGEVMYTAEGWLDRNRDTISEDVVSLMQKSSNELISSLFDAAPAAGEKSAKQRDTVVTKFKTSLAQLMDTIGQTSTQYVRCIKPNKNKSPCEVDNAMVVDQLRCAGVIEAIRISRAGFPARMPLNEFAQRFKLLVRKYSCAALSHCCSSSSSLAAVAATPGDDASSCRMLLDRLVGDDRKYQVGRTRVYFKSGVLESLEERRALLMQAAAVELGRMVRGRQIQRRFQRMRGIARRFQAVWRMHVARVAYIRALRVVVICQGLRRAVLAKRRMLLLRRERSATKLQACWRRHTATKDFIRARRAAVCIQSVARRCLCRRHYLASLAEFKEQAKLENQVKALQAKLEAQERALAAAASCPPGADPAAASAPPAVAQTTALAEVQEALQALAAENARLRIELEHQRSENAKLRRENRKLQTQETNKGALLSLFMRSKKNVDDDRATVASGRIDAMSEVGVHEDDVRPPSTEATKSTSSGSSKRANMLPSGEGDPLQLHPPLSEFWEDMPCIGIPSLQHGSQVHIKLGANILLVDMHGKSLVWQTWMSNHTGYRLPMAFTVEKRTERRKASIWSSAGSEAPEANADGCLGEAFVLRSTWTKKYVKVGGLLDWYCLLVSGQSRDDAAAFSCKPVQAIDSAGGNEATSYFFTLQLVGEEKCLSLRSDGSISMEKVPDVSKAPNKHMIVAAMECLLPARSYELVVYEQHIGLTVSKDLPLSVVGFKNVVQRPGTPPEPGPAESSGRVRVGDVIVSVNGQDISALPRQESLNLINSQRPLTLGFLVSDAT